MPTIEIRIKFNDNVSEIEALSYAEIIKERLYDDDEPNLIDVTYEVKEDAETKA